MGLLSKLFGKSRGTQSEGAPESAGVREDESLDDLYKEFCRTFYFKPGVKLMDFLRTEGVTNMIDWLRPSTPCAVPKGFIRLAVDATRKGYKFWEMPGISMYYEGNWTEGGGLPPQESRDALSVLAQILEKPIKLYYTETEGGPYMMMEFER